MAGLRVVVALDSFKGSLPSSAAGAAVRAGVLAADPTAEVRVVRLADGGEGTVDALADVRGGTEVPVDGVDAVGRPLRASWLRLPDGTAVLEAARTVGLPQAGPVDRSLPPRASSWGLGLQLRDALAGGARRVLVGLGGTACTDGGTGLLAALGARFDPPAAPGTNPLWDLRGFRGPLRPGGTAPGVELVGLTDVTSPLLGPAGSAAVFGPQKGAAPEDVAHLEAAMTRWAALLGAAAGRDLDVPGAGAAGGLGAALLALGGRLEPGFDVVAREAGLDALLVGADLVLTGEGRVDAQTAAGKAPAGVARRARAAGALVVALAGSVGHPLGATQDLFDAVLPVHARPLPEAQALDPDVTADALRAAAAQVVRLVGAARRSAG